MRWQDRRGFAWLPHIALLVLALAVAAEYVRPFRAASVAWDAAASVLHFERIAAGRHLEAFVPTTPKPLLTVVYGGLYSVTGDWRVLAWATLAAAAVGVVVAAEVVRRSLGWVAAAFAGVALAGCVALLYDIGYVLATPWAFLCVAAAGLALSVQPRRPGLAGLLLLLGALARLEVLVGVGVAAVALLLRSALGDRAPGGRPRSPEWLVLLGGLAVPIMAIHDTLLTGDPWFWATVPARYSATTQHPIASVAETLGFLATRYGLELLPLTLLAVVGIVALVRERRWLLLSAIVAFGPGVAAFLVLLAARAIYIPARYTAPIDISAIVAASAAVGWIARITLQRRRGDRASAAGSWHPAAAVVAALVVGVAVAWPTGALDRSLQTTITRSRRLTLDEERLRATLLAAVRAAPSVALPPGQPRLLVPNDLVPRLTVELDVPFTTFGTFVARDVDPAVPRPMVGQVVLHDRNVDRAIPPLEISGPAPFGPATATPLAVNRRRGYWLVAIG